MLPEKASHFYLLSPFHHVGSGGGGGEINLVSKDFKVWIFCG